MITQIDSRDYPSLAAAATAAVSQDVGLLITRNETFSMVMSIPVPVTVEKGGGFTKSGSGKIAFAAPFYAGRYQVFFEVSVGDMTFPGDTLEFCAEWWGATVDNELSDQAALEAAGVAAVGRSLILSKGTYRSTSYLDFVNVNVIGAGPGQTIISSYTTNTTYPAAMYFSTAKGNTLKGITFQSMLAGQNGVEIRGSSPQVENLEIKEFSGTGLKFGTAGVAGCYYAKTKSVRVSNSTTQGVNGVWVTGQPAPSSNDNDLSGVQVSGRWTTLYRIDGTNNRSTLGDANPDTRGTGVDAVWNISGPHNKVDGTYVELIPGSGYPTKLVRFAATSHSSVINKPYLANAGYTMATAIEDLGWGNEFIQRPIGWNWPTFERGISGQNLIANSDFRFWNGNQPLGWKTWTGIVTQETTIVRGSKYAMKITGADEYINVSYYISGLNTTYNSRNQVPIQYLRGKMVTGGCWIWSEHPLVGQVKIGDGTSYGTGLHTGSGAWEWVGATAKISSTATFASFEIRASSGGNKLNGSIYVSEPMAVVGNTVPIFSPRPLTDGKAELMGPLIHAPRIIFADGDTTPSVADGNRFIATNTNPTTITIFDNGADGQELFLMSTNDNTTVKHNSSINTLSGADTLLTANKIYRFLGDVDRYREL